MTTPTFGQRIRAHLNAATTTRGGHRPVALPPVTEHEPAPPPGGWGDVLARLARANERVANLGAQWAAEKTRADTAERRLADSGLAAADHRIRQLEQEITRLRSGADAELIRDLAEARTENAALRQQRSRDRERITRLEADLERCRELDIAREQRHGFGGFEGRPDPVHIERKP